MAERSTALHLYRSHRAALIDYANRITGDRSRAEDVVQEAWLKLDGASLRQDIANPLGLLYRIVRNISLDGARRQAFERRLMGERVEEIGSTIADETPSPERRAIAEAELRAVLEGLRELPERTRIAFEMHRFGGYKLKDIAAHLGISTGLVHALIADAVRHCAERLERDG